MPQKTTLENPQRRRIWRKFILNISLILLIFILGVYFGLAFRNNQLVRNEILTRARAIYNQIILTRLWIARYNGVLVEKTPGMRSNPYLKDPDIVAKDGKIYTKKNPALMTKELSILSREHGNATFHITSLKPLNPENSPTPLERKTLEGFEKGEREYYQNIEENQKVLFFYMAPLIVEKSCLKCHSSQNYKIGDIRGGISIRFDISETVKSLNFQHNLFIGLTGLISIILFSIIYLYIYRLIQELSHVYAEIEELAVIDELTGLFNRRFVDNKLIEEINRAVRFQHDLSIIMLDLDHFKSINDVHGHLNGDIALREIAQLAKKTCRNTDTVARFGGEEFLIILPNVKMAEAIKVAEKIRKEIEGHSMQIEKKSLHLTVSLGVAAITSDISAIAKDARAFVNMADAALYRAKQKGRNRVEA